MGIDPVADTLRVMFGKLAQPPADGFLDEPFAVVRQPLQPAKGCVRAAPVPRVWGCGYGSRGKGADQRRAPHPEAGVIQPGLDLVQPARVGKQPPFAGIHGVVGDGPKRRIAAPSRRSAARRPHLAGCAPASAAWRRRCAPHGCRCPKAAMPDRCAPASSSARHSRQPVDHRDRDAQIDARRLVIGGHPGGLASIAKRLQLLSSCMSSALFAPGFTLLIARGPAGVEWRRWCRYRRCAASGAVDFPLARAPEGPGHLHRNPVGVAPPEYRRIAPDDARQGPDGGRLRHAEPPPAHGLSQNISPCAKTPHARYRATP